MDGPIVTYHAPGNLPLYDIPYEIIVGKGINDVVKHGESLFPGASLIKARDFEAYACKMQHPEKKTRYMLLVDVTNEEQLATLIAGEAVAMSWYMMEHVNLQCDTKNHDSQKHIVKAIFDQVTNVIGVFFQKVEEDDRSGLDEL